MNYSIGLDLNLPFDEESSLVFLPSGSNAISYYEYVNDIMNNHFAFNSQIKIKKEIHALSKAFNKVNAVGLDV